MIAPSCLVIKLSLALDTTPDEFLVGSIRYDTEAWRDVAELLRGMEPKKLTLAKSFLTWLLEQNL